MASGTLGRGLELAAFWSRPRDAKLFWVAGMEGRRPLGCESRLRTAGAVAGRRESAEGMRRGRGRGLQGGEGAGPGALPASRGGRARAACQGARSFAQTLSQSSSSYGPGRVSTGPFCRNLWSERAVFGALASTLSLPTLDEKEFLVLFREVLLIVYLPR